MAKNIVPTTPLNTQKAPPIYAEDMDRATRIQMGLEIAHCWARPGQTSPGNNYNPAEMRDQVVDILHHLPDRFVLVLFWVSVSLVGLLSEPPAKPPEAKQ